MTKNLEFVLRTRVNFGKINNIVNPPNLVEVQTKSYEKFLQRKLLPSERKNQGMEAIFRNIFPITDSLHKYKVEYIDYRLGEPRNFHDECKNRGTSYTVPIYARFKLISYEVQQNYISKNPKIKEISEDEIFFGEFPLMTSSGYFVINGTERVIVNQLHRSPGVFFLENKTLDVTRGQIYKASIIPQRGSWLDFEFDSKDMLFTKVDRKKKILISTFLQALGYSKRNIIEKFYPNGSFFFFGENIYQQYDKKIKENVKVRKNIYQKGTLQLLKEKNTVWTSSEEKKYANDLHGLLVQTSLKNALAAVVLRDVFDNEGNIIAKFNEPFSEELLEKFAKHKITSVDYFLLESENIDSSLRKTISVDKINSIEDAIIDIYKKLKTSVTNLAKGQEFVDSFLFDKNYYSLSAIGRMQFNKKFKKNKPLEQEVLEHEDIFDTIFYLFQLRKGKVIADDIDNLKNRRVKTVGELLAQCFNKGMFRLAKNIREKMIFLEEQPKLQNLINIKLVTGVVHDFFATNQLSQFMDQTNPLSEMTHKRRLSALGPGGLSRERAGFEVRDVHPSHYGRICPIETPEGSSIGLMSSLTIFAKINDFGFIETPYRKVEDTQLTTDVEYMSALEDSSFYIAQSNALLDKNEKFIKEIIALRKNSEFRSQPREWAQWIDLSPHQLVSVAASLIPFLEHDDANRALMGSNMQRQAVPLSIPEAPFVGTGMEELVAKDSGMCVLSGTDGTVCYVDAKKIIVTVEDRKNKDQQVKIKVYKLQKYDRSNQNTCINQIPLVVKGDRVQKGQIIADGAACEQGELALGKNVRVAFMSWYGFNYEDSLVVSEKLLHKDVFTSVHIEKFEVTARETKIGKENITRDIPNSSESRLKNLDETGIIRPGCYVKTGDILVGKTTPKTESRLNPEEKLLQAIFGEKAGDIRDTSLRVPQGVSGIVIDIKIFNRRGLEKKTSMVEREEEMIKNIDQDNQEEIFALKKSFLNRHKNLLENEKLQYDVVNTKTHEILFAKNEIVSTKELIKIPIQSLLEIKIKDNKKNEQLSNYLQKLAAQVEIINTIYQDLIEKKKRSEDLPQGVNRIIKVYIAMKRKLSVGDKMAGRHGNKGVVSKILPVEDMPYTQDGEPIDFILNPLSVPSRMNIGQILETHLGMVAKNLGKEIDKMMKTMAPYAEIKKFVKKIYQSDYVSKYLDSLEDNELVEFFKKLKNGVYFATPVFDGSKEDDICRLMDLCNMSYSGKEILYDGLTGEKLKQRVTVGYKYMCKLYHLVDDKIHARSTGPYSLVTQQPLGGKSHSGGQRFGEMEVWSLEAYGAAFILKELLTVKSDDIYGRNKAYESIVKGEFNYDSGIPESFKVLVNELRSLCIDLELIGDLKQDVQEIVE